MQRSRPHVPPWKGILPRITDGDPEAISLLFTILAEALPRFIRNPPGYAQREDGVQMVLSSLYTGILAPIDAGWEVGDRKFPWRDLDLNLPIDQPQPAFERWARNVADHLRHKHRQGERLHLRLIESTHAQVPLIHHADAGQVADIAAYLALLNGKNRSEVKARYGVLKSLLHPWAKALEVLGQDDAPSLPVSRLCKRVCQEQDQRFKRGEAQLRPQFEFLDEALTALQHGIHHLELQAERDEFEKGLRQALDPRRTVPTQANELRPLACNMTSFFVLFWTVTRLQGEKVNNIDVLAGWDPAQAPTNEEERQRASEKASELLLTVPALYVILAQHSKI